MNLNFSDNSTRKSKSYHTDSYQQKINGLIANLNTVIFILDESDTFIEIFCNENAVFYPYIQNFVGKGSKDVLPPNIHQKYIYHSQILRDSLQRQFFTFTLRINAKSNWFRASLHLYGDEKTIILIVHDIDSDLYGEDKSVFVIEPKN